MRDGIAIGQGCFHDSRVFKIGGNVIESRFMFGF